MTRPNRDRADERAPFHAKNFSESEQPALLGPVGREPRGPAHQRFGVESLRLATVDNCRGDVGCQPGQPQESITSARFGTAFDNQPEWMREMKRYELEIHRMPRAGGDVGISIP